MAIRKEKTSHCHGRTLSHLYTCTTGDAAAARKAEQDFAQGMGKANEESAPNKEESLNEADIKDSFP